MIGGVRKWIKRRYNRWSHGGVTCLQADAFVLDYVEGTLDVRRKRIFEAHLAACPLCIAYLKDYKKAVSMAKSSAHRDERLIERAPQSLVDAIVKAVAPTS